MVDRGGYGVYVAYARRIGVTPYSVAEWQRMTPAHRRMLVILATREGGK